MGRPASHELLRSLDRECGELASKTSEKVRLFLRAAGRSFLARGEGLTVAIGSVPEWAREFGAAISGGVAGAWRERWWSSDLLLLSDFEEVTKLERAKAELSHLFEVLTHRGARILIGANRPPGPIEGLPERMASRLEVGLAVDLGGEAPPEPKKPDTGVHARAGAGEEVGAAAEGGAPARASLAEADFAESVAEKSLSAEPWTPSPERVVWDWPVLEDWLAEPEPEAEG